MSSSIFVRLLFIAPIANALILTLRLNMMDDHNSCRHRVTYVVASPITSVAERWIMGPSETSLFLHQRFCLWWTTPVNLPFFLPVHIPYHRVFLFLQQRRTRSSRRLLVSLTVTARCFLNHSQSSSFLVSMSRRIYVLEFFRHSCSINR